MTIPALIAIYKVQYGTDLVSDWMQPHSSTSMSQAASCLSKVVSTEYDANPYVFKFVE